MASYVPRTETEKKEMLNELGFSSFDELFSVVPKSMKVDLLNIPTRKSELETRKIVQTLANKNKVFGSIFRGAGSYNHYIPSIVKAIMSKEEFVTAYTPYQAEISQGLLQMIFEFQTMICELTGMDAANANVYDGATAAAEAVAMCIDRKRKKAIISSSSNTMVIDTIKSYSFGSGVTVVLAPTKDGKTDIDELAKLLTDDVCCVYVEQTNYFGIIEDCEEIGSLISKHPAKFIIGVNPIANMVLKSPRECLSDIAVGEAQQLGLPMSFGGPYLGFMSCTEDLIRKLPGRIVGETKDSRGNKAYVLTLQAREQHIRREKATSNICSNQSLCSLAVSVYMSAMGTEGITNVANTCLSNAHYLKDELCKIDGFDLVYDQEFFNEFVTSSKIDAQKLIDILKDNDILGGYPIKEGILWCATELNDKQDIDRLIKIIKEVC